MRAINELGTPLNKIEPHVLDPFSDKMLGFVQVGHQQSTIHYAKKQRTLRISPPVRAIS